MIFSDAEKAEIGSLFESLHEQFARTIVWYKTPQQTVVSTSVDHNFFFQDAANNTQVSLIQQSGSMAARILYGQKNAINDLLLRTQRGGSEGMSNLYLDAGEVRIKIAATGAAIFDDVERVIIDGVPYQKTSANRFIGPFSNLPFVSIYLRQVN